GERTRIRGRRSAATCPADWAGQRGRTNPASIFPSSMSAVPVTTTGSLAANARSSSRSEEHTSELQSRVDLVCRLLLEKKKHTPSFMRPREASREKFSEVAGKWTRRVL